VHSGRTLFNDIILCLISWPSRKLGAVLYRGECLVDVYWRVGESVERNSRGLP
jgi:hypothetical protein